MDLFDEASWRSAWRAAGPRRRLRIARAVGKGEALPDRESAFLAVGLVRHARGRWWVHWVAVAILLAAFILAMGAWGDWGWVAGYVVLFAYPLLFPSVAVGSFRVREALHRNEAVLEGFNAGPLNNASFEEIAAWRSSNVGH